MNSRTWLAISLACFIWFGYIKWFAPVPPQGSVASAPAAQTNGGAPAAPSAATPTTPAPQVDASVSAVSSTLYRAGNNDFEAAFSAKGGRLAEIKLKKYKGSIEKNAEPILMLSPEVNAQALAGIFSDADLAGFTNAEYSQNASGPKITMTATSKGTTVTKMFSIPEKGFAIDAAITIQVPQGSKKSAGYLTFPLGGKGLAYAREIPLSSWEAIYFQDEKAHRTVWDKIPDTEEVKQGNTNWVAFGNRYFATAIVNEAEINPDVLLSKKGDFSGAYVRYPVVFKEGQNSVTYKYKIYAGPKVVTELEQFHGLKQLIDYGTFSFFAYPLLGILRFFHKFVNNFGIAIILLTLLVRVLFYPLSVKSFKSMKAMQKLQPQIQALKEKYKDDMGRMNQEQMALFKAHKVNPMGGCFPMLIQLPVFIALYAVLGNSIELFQSPFFGWIHDLSTKDPFYIYPVLMGISMFLQQKMTPAVGMDPAQQKIMLFMPVMFSFMMIGLPSGLTLYIFVSTLLGIAQQWSMMRDPKTNSTLAIAETSPKTK